MPEGPEVETIRMGLLPVVGTKILEVKVADHKKYLPQKPKIQSLINFNIHDIKRFGKFLVFYFQKDNSTVCALNHLGMTGVWYLYSDKTWEKFQDPFDEYSHWKVYFRLSDNSHLLFVNVRTFGRFEIYTPEEIDRHSSIATLGPDILADPFDVDEFLQRMRGKSKNNRTKEVGKCLLDYSIVAGCGNIYKNEALFMSRINPFCQADQLTDEQIIDLGHSLSKVGKTALKYKGSSLKDYKHVDGYSGLMQNQFKVYDKQSQDCPRCGSKIFKGTQGDRSSFWCPSCQPMPLG